MPVAEAAVIDPGALDELVRALRVAGVFVFSAHGARGGDRLRRAGFGRPAPIGWTDEQATGRYRLERRDDEARFGFAVGPHSWKQFLLPPRLRLWRARRATRAFEVEPEPTDDTPLAFFGVRACELHGIAIQDRVLLEGQFVDATTPRGGKTRSSSLSIASSPAAPASASRWAPDRKRRPGYDLALTEILDGSHRFLVEVGTARGSDVLADLPRRPAEDRRPAGGAKRSKAPRNRWDAAGHRPTCAGCWHATSSTPAGTTSRRAA